MKTTKGFITILLVLAMLLPSTVFGTNGTGTTSSVLKPSTQPTKEFEERYVVPPVKVEKKQFKFDLNSSLYRDVSAFGGGYNKDYNWITTCDVETWSKDTKLEFIHHEDAKFEIVAIHAMRLNSNNEMMVEDLTCLDIPPFKVVDKTSGPYKPDKDGMYTSWISRKDCYEVSFFDDTKIYTEKDDNVYLYIMTRYVPKGTVLTEKNFNSFYKVRFVKFDNTRKPGSIPTRVIATPTMSKVSVNGKLVSFETYAINGSNYFKLPDMAMILSGTTKQFDIGWNDEDYELDIKSNKPYQKVGGELAKGNGKVKQGILNTSTKYKDGKEVELTSYFIYGNELLEAYSTSATNYYKLRDLAEVLDIGVRWDNATKTVVIDTSKGYISE